MNTPIKILSTAILGLTLSGCVDDYESTTPTASQPETGAEQACLAAVAKSTGNYEVTVLSSEFSEAGTFVKVGVGPNKAPWKCVAYKDGATDSIMSLTNEGAL